MRLNLHISSSEAYCRYSCVILESTKFAANGWNTRSVKLMVAVSMHNRAIRV